MKAGAGSKEAGVLVPGLDSISDPGQAEREGLGAKHKG